MAIQNSNQQDFKLILIGDGGTGKTTYVTRLLDGKFRRTYVATVGVDVSNVSFKTNYGLSINFEIWDTAGQELKSQLNDLYYLDAHAAIIMFDVTARITFKNVSMWLNKLRLLTTNPETGAEIPVIVCGNKIDKPKRKVDLNHIKGALSQDVTQYVDISARSLINYHIPFLAVARALTGLPDLQFVENINLEPAQVDLDAQQLVDSQQVNDDVSKAQHMKLPDEL